ncbi:hypothetical protein [Hungatella hathewayi]|mgnify:FL=1|uniref:hypothetical protein n=1 Tax=Hungatella hathewayi TaxID=154046 RepID=UPI002A83F408|nr:hypothetical protein [Hungatella hathewayi]
MIEIRTLEKIILFNRKPRIDIIGRDNVDLYYNDLCKTYGIEELNLIVCNTVQKKNSFSLTKQIPFLVLDNYIVELFSILNEAFFKHKDDGYIRSIFSKILQEDYFIQGDYNTSLIYLAFCKHWGKEEKLISNLNDMCYVQQAFILCHEAIHYLFYKEKDIKIEQLADVRKAVNRLVDNNFTKDFPILSDEFIEECSCDNLAAISAIDIGLNYFHYPAIDCAVSIILALCHQYIIFYLSCMSSDRLDHINLREFALRSTYLRMVITHIVEIMDKDSTDVFMTLNHFYERWHNSIWKLFTKFCREEILRKPYYTDLLKE